MLNSFFLRIKAIYFSQSWTDETIGWLYRLPLPFGLTCLILFAIPTGVTYSMNSVISESWLFLALFGGIYFVFAYCIFIVQRLADDTKNLLASSPILRETVPNIPSPASRLIQFKAHSFYPFRIILFVGMLYFIVDMNSFSLTELAQSLLMGFPFFMAFFLAFLLAFRTIKTLSVINRLKSREMEINLFDLSPYYQLSQFTQKTALYITPMSIPFLFSNYVRYNGISSISETYFVASGDFFTVVMLNIMLILGPALIILTVLSNAN